MTDYKNLRTVFMGTPEIAVPSLRALAEMTQLQLVVTQPDRRAGRGGKMRPPPVKVVAEELGIEVWQPHSLRDHSGDFLTDIDLVIVLAYGELLRKPILNAPRLGCINLHASLLPRWRGASPLQSAIRAGDSETGVTVMRMVRALDAGAMYHKRVVPLGPDANLPWLHDTMAEESALALADFLRDHLDADPVEQNPDEVVHCGKLFPEHGQLDWTKTADELCRWVRAYEPAPGCWTTLPDGQRLCIRQIALADGSAPKLQPGQVTSHQKQLLVGCADGAVSILKLQPPCKRAMDAQSFMCGNEVPEYLGQNKDVESSPCEG